ncbi:MAG TPA: uroporphyrinogen-III synthase [Acidobacteriota bacterium]|nr:uroporphyrinogen-III synthase [Acidobacteriota bacterium]
MSQSGTRTGPLHNLTVVVACSSAKIDALKNGLEEMGGFVIPLVVIEPRGIEDTAPLDRAILSLPDYSWILFTSVHGVSFFMKRLQKLLDEGRVTVDRATFPAICAVGPATAAALEQFGHKAALIPEDFVAEGVYKALASYHGGIENLAGRRVLFARAKEGRDFLPEALIDAGVDVDLVAYYRTVRADVDAETIRKIRENKVDLSVFTSASTIRNMIEILGRERGEQLLAESTVAVIGPVTAEAAESFGKRADIIPGQNTISALLCAIENHYKGASNAKTH